MDFITDFLKAVFIERDKAKIKESITMIALVIIAFWIVKAYNNINDGIENNSKKIDKVSNYRIVIINVTDSVFNVKSEALTSKTNEKIQSVVEMVKNLDNKRRQEIDYITKYKDKSYQEIMDILKINEERWDFNTSAESVMSDFAEPKMIELAPLGETEFIIIKETPVSHIPVSVKSDSVEVENVPEAVDVDKNTNEKEGYKRTQEDSTKTNIFKRIGEWFQPKDTIN